MRKISLFILILCSTSFAQVFNKVNSQIVWKTVSYEGVSENEKATSILFNGGLELLFNEYVTSGLEAGLYFSELTGDGFLLTKHTILAELHRNFSAGYVGSIRFDEGVRYEAGYRLRFKILFVDGYEGNGFRDTDLFIEIGGSKSTKYSPTNFSLGLTAPLNN